MSNNEQIEGNQALDYVQKKVATALRYQSRKPEHAAAYGAAAGMLKASEYSAMSGDLDAIEYALEIVKTTLDELRDGLHRDDADKIEGRIIPYNEEVQV